jgi:chromosome partitioning protein
MKTLVLANQKGGVGKSAVATLLAHYLVRHGRRVLSIDLDHQGNFSSPLVLSKRVCVAPITADRLLTEGCASVPHQTHVLVPAADSLMLLERQSALHTPFARNLRAFLRSVDPHFDVCVIDTHPNPDIRVISALANADYLLSPLQLNQEAIDGVRALLHHQRVGFHKIKTLLNPKLSLIGLLPTLVEPTPFQRANLAVIVRSYRSLLIELEDGVEGFAFIPKRSAIAEAQAEGQLIWEMKKTAARDAWLEIEPSLRSLEQAVFAHEASHAV